MRQLLGRERLEGAAQHREGDERQGTRPCGEPGRREPLERPDDRGAHKLAERVVERDAHGAETSVQLAPQQDDDCDPHAADHRRGQTENACPLRTCQRDESQGGRNCHADGGAHAKGRPARQRRHAASQGRKGEEHRHACDVEKRPQTVGGRIGHERADEADLDPGTVDAQAHEEPADVRKREAPPLSFGLRRVADICDGGARVGHDGTRRRRRIAVRGRTVLCGIVDTTSQSHHPLFACLHAPTFQ